MARRLTPSQFRTKIRQLQSQQRQAIARHNQQVRKYNQSIRNLQSAISRYNREVASYNSRRRTALRRLNSELSKLRYHRSTTHAPFQASSIRLHTTYARLDSSAALRSLSPSENFFLDLSENEAANSAEALNAILFPEAVRPADSSLQQSAITDELAVISEELDSRWRGALFSLHPNNPEASRHFCTSARELFNEILDIKAPNSAILAASPNCALTELGQPTRRARIAFLLAGKDIRLPEAADFADEDVANIIELLEILNSGTHGGLGHFQLASLSIIKRRVEDGLIFLSRLAA